MTVDNFYISPAPSFLWDRINPLFFEASVALRMKIVMYSLNVVVESLQKPSTTPRSV